MRKPANNYARMEDGLALGFCLQVDVRCWGRVCLVCNFKGFK